MLKAAKVLMNALGKINKIKNNFMLDKNINFASNFYSFLWHFAKKHKFYLFLYTFFFVIVSYSLDMLLVPYFLKYFIDNISNLSLKNGIFLLFLCAFSRANFLVYAINQKFIFESIRRTSEDIRRFLFTRLLKQSIDYFDTSWSGEIIRKINAIVSSILMNYTMTIMLARNIFMSLICIIIFCNYTMNLGLLIIFYFIIYHFIGFKMAKIYADRCLITNNKIVKFQGFVNDIIVNISNVKAFTSRRREKKNLISNINSVIKAEKFQFEQKYLTNFLSFCFAILIFGSVLFVLVSQLIKGQINLGSFIFGVEIARDMVELPVTTFDFMQSLGARLKYFNDNLSIIRDEIRIKDKENAHNLVIKDGRIVFKGVSFGYERQKRI